MSETNKLKFETIETVIEYSGKLINAVDYVTGLLQEGKDVEANNVLSDFIDGIKWVVEALELTKDIHSIDVSSINNDFNALVDCLSNSDFVSVADILEYEIAETLKSWINILQESLEKQQ
ncbi:MAG: hypothetical protein ACOZCL_16335 [Bacillota bacterium]